MANGTFTATADVDDGVTRNVGDDQATGNNKFTTTRTQDPGSGSGTYSITADGVVTVNFSGDDPESISGLLSANGQTFISGYSEFDDTEMYASIGLGIGVKKAVTQKSVFSAIYLLLNE